MAYLPPRPVSCYFFAMICGINKSKAGFFLSAIFLLITIIQLSAISASLWERRHWDLLAYVGLAYEIDGLAGADMHTATYRAAREGSTAAGFQYLTERPGIAGRADYRVEAHHSAVVFAEQLPFYSVKRFYPAAIWALGKLGFSPVLAASIITFTGYIAATSVLFFWLREFLPALLALSVTGAVMTSIYMLPIAFIRTPDTWAATLLVLAFFRALTDRFATATAIATIAILVRPDAVLALGAICAFAAWRGHWRTVVIGAIGGVALFTAATTGGYPWTTFFYHSFVAALHYPSEFQSPLGLWQYIVFYVERVAAAPFLNPIFPGVLVLGGLTILIRIQRSGWRDAYAAFVALALGCMLLHWLVYPAGVTRHQMPYYMVIVVALARHFAEAFAGRRSEKATVSLERG